MLNNDNLLRDGETDKGREMRAITETLMESVRARETITIGQIEK